MVSMKPLKFFVADCVLEGLMHRVPAPPHVLFIIRLSMAGGEPLIPIACELTGLCPRESASGPVALSTDGSNAALHFG